MARSRGVSERGLTWRYAMGNSAIPVVTALGTRFAAMLNGVVVVEVVFAWPGVGSLVVRALETRDYPLIQATVLVTVAPGGRASSCSSTSATRSWTRGSDSERPPHEHHDRLTARPRPQPERPAEPPERVTDATCTASGSTPAHAAHGAQSRSGSARSAPCWSSCPSCWPSVLPLPDPNAQDLGARRLPPLTDGHLFGTDQLGRDLLSRCCTAARSR